MTSFRFFASALLSAAVVLVTACSGGDERLGTEDGACDAQDARGDGQCDKNLGVV